MGKQARICKIIVKSPHFPPYCKGWANRFWTVRSLKLGEGVSNRYLAMGFFRHFRKCRKRSDLRNTRVFPFRCLKSQGNTCQFVTLNKYARHYCQSLAIGDVSKGTQKTRAFRRGFRLALLALPHAHEGFGF